MDDVSDSLGSMNTTLFPDVVGQEEPKKKLGFYLRAYHHTRIMENIMLCSPKGQGKSMIAKEIGKNLYLYGPDNKPVKKESGGVAKKTFFDLTGSSFKTKSGFINDFILKKVVGKDCTIFIDEAHGLSYDITEALLIMLAPNKENRNTYMFNDIAIDIDFRLQTFLFATSESHLVFPPLMDRFKRVDLQYYSTNELGQIIARALPDVTFADDVLEIVASVVRNNARQAVGMANDIRKQLCGKTTFGFKQWKDMVNQLSIKPLGLSPIEIKLMRLMEERSEGSSLTNLAARSGLSREAVQRDYEGYLQSQNLMEITAGKGRCLTAKGYQYLKQLATWNA